MTTTTITPNCPAFSGKPLYLRLIKDNTGKPVPNANVSGSPGFTCDGTTTLITILFQPAVNSSGVAILNDSYSSWWTVDVHYSGNAYHFKFDMRPHQTTYVTVRLPSGNWTLTYG